MSTTPPIQRLRDAGQFEDLQKLHLADLEKLHDELALWDEAAATDHRWRPPEGWTIGALGSVGMAAFEYLDRRR
jgi:hypothetical protein